MNFKKDAKNLRKAFETFLAKLSWLAPLLTRLSVGFIFLTSGWGKVHNLPKVIEYFQSLGMPAAPILAPFVSVIELFCGGLLMLGLFSQVSAFLLCGVMTVALLTAKKEDISDLSDLFGISEYLYLLLLLWLTTHGPGWLSLDVLIGRKTNKQLK